jgi:hypothetical protein
MALESRLLVGDDSQPYLPLPLSSFTKFKIEAFYVPTKPDSLEPEIMDDSPPVLYPLSSYNLESTDEHCPSYLRSTYPVLRVGERLTLFTSARPL